MIIKVFMHATFSQVEQSHQLLQGRKPHIVFVLYLAHCPESLVHYENSLSVHIMATYTLIISRIKQEYLSFHNLYTVAEQK